MIQYLRNFKARGSEKVPKIIELYQKSESPKGASLSCFLKRKAANGIACPSVLMVHGWKSNFGTTFNEIQTVCLELGCNVFLLTLSGHGSVSDTIKTVTREDHLDDVTRALRYVTTCKEADATKIIGIGSSYGAYLLAAAANAQSFKALLLRAPALYPDENWDTPTQQVVESDTLADWRTHMHSAEESTALAGIASHNGKLLVVSGGKDEDMPVQVARSYGTAASNAQVHHIMLSQAGHVFAGESRDAYLRYSSAWLEGILTNPLH